MKVDLCYASIREDEMPFYRASKHSVIHIESGRKTSKQIWLLKCIFSNLINFIFFCYFLEDHYSVESLGWQKQGSTAVLFIDKMSDVIVSWLMK